MVSKQFDVPAEQNALCITLTKSFQITDTFQVSMLPGILDSGENMKNLYCAYMHIYFDLILLLYLI